MPLWLIVAATAVYIAALFAIAWSADRMPRDAAASRASTGILYALSLTVYCTSWTFYGAVGTAATSGWDYLWILLGPALVFALLPVLHRRLADVGQRENVSSLSDFLSARYGKSGGLAALAAIAAVAGTLPYIALQLKSLSTSLAVLSGGVSAASTQESVLGIALAMALFSILFGARSVDATARNRGLIRVLAVEAIIKLLALGAVAAFSLSLLPGRPDFGATAFADFQPTSRSLVILLISMTAILCLPRQFHLTVVERERPSDSDWARWLLPLYLLLVAALVVPITLTGLSVLPSSASPDAFVLALPLDSGHPGLGLLVFLGGVAAATGMVIVASLTLSIMVTNNLLVPLLLKSSRSGLRNVTGHQILAIRRAVIVILMLLAYAYFRAAGDGSALASIGLLSFAAAAQFAPLIIGGLFWPRAHRMGALAGLGSGILIWAWTLFLPEVVGADALRSLVPALLDPHALLGSTIADSLVHGTIWSLGVNMALFVSVSAMARTRLRDTVQSVAFASHPGTSTQGPMPLQTPVGKPLSDRDLRALATRFLDAQAVDHAFAGFRASAPEGGWERVQQTERLLSRVIGASTARIIMASALSGQQVRFDDVLRIFDQKSARRMFDDHAVQALLEHLGDGISIVDADQNLVAWNGPYIDLFDYPDTLLKVGTPISALIRHNIESGWITGGNPEDISRRRVQAMREGRAHIYERKNPDGRYLRIEGHPLPGGGYLTSFRDITRDRLREDALREANETLEARVAERTEDLRRMAETLALAKREAEAANASKTRFLAAASHDLLQPLNAARLFLGSVPDADTGAVSKAQRAIQSADELLKGLLDISRLDQSDIQARPSRFPLAPLLEDLAEEARPMALRAGLDVRVAPTSLSVVADPTFLESILRNFLSNARRYTLSGGVLIGARRAGRDHVRVEVWDTGPGLTPDQRTSIFEEFVRASDADNAGMRGAGLGLSVVRRLASIMGADIAVRSRPGRGSVFSVTVPRATDAVPASRLRQAKRTRRAASLSGLGVAYIDDEPLNLSAMRTLLESWGCRVRTCDAPDQLEAGGVLDPATVIIADHDLGTSTSGLSYLVGLKESGFPASHLILLTAAQEAELESSCREAGITLLRKPADPDQLFDALAKADAYQDGLTASV